MRARKQGKGGKEGGRLTVGGGRCARVQLAVLAGEEADGSTEGNGESLGRGRRISHRSQRDERGVERTGDRRGRCPRRRQPGLDKRH